MRLGLRLGVCPGRTRRIVWMRPISPFEPEELRAASKFDCPALVGRSSSVIGAYGENKNATLV
jgi:hypothetical protein